MRARETDARLRRRQYLLRAGAVAGQVDDDCAHIREALDQIEAEFAQLLRRIAGEGVLHADFCGFLRRATLAALPVFEGVMRPYRDEAAAWVRGKLA